ncbi:MAG: asparagine synthase (glutamine-hydrolyzing) [Candidatus Omnitrophica bacterium]|nr:asparagine synthase (glutamine-hydrolyzing) [Candidatus Omnitrophota bacterium]
MCGICGIVGKQDKQLLEKMCNTMLHRGPDSNGTFAERDVGLGIRRLRIIDLETGDQPIHNEDKTKWIIHNGEIYNFKELREDLIRKGHRFYTKSDTEVILHLYEEYKDDCVKFLRGMFVFAIWDNNEKRLFLARDRVGIKPLYYSFRNAKLVFASQLRAILQDKEISHSIDLEALDYYLTFLYIPAPLTIFRDIRKLPPAHTLTIKNGNIKIKRYWRLDFKQDKIESDDYYKERLIEILREVMQLHMISDVPLGALLSGGLDSSTIVAMMSRLSRCPIKTFSIGFEKRFSSYNELEYSRLIAEKFHTEHREFIIRPKIIDILPQIVSHSEEPFADSSAILNYLICQEAKKFVTVGLTGIGGDEIFGGYPRYLGLIVDKYYQRLPHFLRSGLSGLSNFIPQTSDSQNIGGRLSRFIRSNSETKNGRYIRWLTYFDSDMKSKLLNQEPKDYRYIHYNYLDDEKSNDFLNKASYLDINTYLPNDLLIMADKMSMAHSFELRVPLCDHKLMEFCAGIPFSMKLKGLKLKSLFKETIKDILPEKVVNKRKQGFMVPLADWLREDLKDYVLQTLNESNIKKGGYFNSKYIAKILDMHFKGKAIYTHQIWALFIFEIWQRNFINNNI